MSLAVKGWAPFNKLTKIALASLYSRQMAMAIVAMRASTSSSV